MLASFHCISFACFHRATPIRGSVAKSLTRSPKTATRCFLYHRVTAALLAVAVVVVPVVVSTSAELAVTSAAATVGAWI
jgi:hypothetical protein